jgi:hypothetical protein
MVLQSHFLDQVELGLEPVDVFVLALRGALDARALGRAGAGFPAIGWPG